MEKAGLKTFVCSFVFSLFTVFTINGVYWHARYSSVSEIKIPNKNITLFLRDDAKIAAYSQAIPTKKIVLSFLPDVAKKPLATVDPIPLMAENSIDESSLQALVLTQNIPLENSNEQSADFKKDKITMEYEEIMRKKALQARQTPQEKLSEKEASQQVSDISLNEALNNSPPKKALESEIFENILTEPSPMILPATGTITLAQTEPPANLNLGVPQNLISANETKSGNTEAEKPVADKIDFKAQPKLLIPLEKDSGVIRTGSKGNEVTNKAASNQVALNADSIPIKSMLNDGTPSDTGRDTDSDDAGWRTMEEKTHSSDPWVVAQGAKFPSNNLIKADAKYLQDETEIKKVLSANRISSGKANTSGEVKLASETVKNLLIPIPEDILKDDNLTPQLISSTKEQTSEEGLAAKELENSQMRKKQEEALARETVLTQTNTTATPEQSSITDSSGVTKKAGILDSITSIFSSNKAGTAPTANELPEVGDQVGGNDNSNSLLSAFTRKRTRDNSTMKILPTEIRLSFQPNRAEISGQTLKWIHAFANKTIKETSSGLEIRIDGTSSPLLQQRRLNLLHNILTSEGVDYNKVNTVFTAREPNSLVIRTIKINNEPEENTRNMNNAPNNRYMQW